MRNSPRGPVVAGAVCWTSALALVSPVTKGWIYVDADYSAEGSWVREMAERYEHADFVGADIVPIPPPASAIAEMGVSSLLRTTYVRTLDVSLFRVS